MKCNTTVFTQRLSASSFVVMLLCVWASFAQMLMANTVAIGDASFDVRSISSGGTSLTITPWQETGGTGNSNGWIGRVTGFAADGQNHLSMNLNHNVWQDLGITYQANMRYTLTVAVGNRSGTTNTGNQSRYQLAASDGTVFGTGTQNASTFAAANTFADAVLVFETGSASTAIGKTLRIILQARGVGRSHFDRIRLTAVSTIPPDVTMGAVTALTQASATLNATINPNGNAITVSYEYGLTIAYGSTSGAIPSVVSGNTSSAVSAKLTGLLSNTVYQYRMVLTTNGVPSYGSNATFTTDKAAALSLTPPLISLSTPSGESTSAALSVANSGQGAGEWSLELMDANGRADNVSGALAAILASGTSINGPLPSRFDFTEGETGSAIADGGTGGTALFTAGNQLSTSLGGPINYSDGVASTAASLGVGGSYFTKKLPGLFIFGAELNGASWFEVNGSITYATGTRQMSEFSITRNGRRWSAFVAKTQDYWRTINHLILVDQGGLTATTGTSVSDQKHRISGLTGKRKLFHMLYATSTTAVQPDSVFQDLATRMIDTLPMPFGSIFSAAPPTGITAAGGNTPITLTANSMGLAPGSYPFQLRATSDTGALFDTTQGTLQVTVPRLAVPADLFRAVPVGMDPLIVDVPITSNDLSARAWTASLPGTPSWLTLDTPSGTTPSPLKLRFATGSLAAGNYATILRVTSQGAVFEISVRLSVNPLTIRKFLPDPNRPVIYALNQNGKNFGELLEINTITKSIKRAVQVGKEPSDLDLTASGNQLVVINTSDPSLSVVDLASFSVAETIPLTEFSNRNEDVGGHVKCGKGSIVYYVDEQWGPRLRVFDTATKTVLQTLSATSNTSPDTSNNFGFGDINLTPDRSSLFGWAQYGDGAGSSATNVVRFTVGQDGRLSGFAKSADYSTSNFTRQPFDTPVLFSRDGSKMIIKDRVILQTELDSHPIVYPNVIYSISTGGEIAISSTAIIAGEGGEILHNLPVSSTVQAVSPDYSVLLYFNATAKSLAWLDLPATVGNARLGLELTPAEGSTVAQPSRLKWLPITGITRYQVYFGSNRSDVENATTASPLYLGLANGNEIALSGGLVAGQTYYWRAVPVDAASNPVGAGTVQSFSVSNMTFSRSSIAAETVQGVTNHVETIQFESALPQEWTATENTAWIKSVTPAGTTPGTLSIVIDASGLAAGLYQGSVTVTSSGAPVVVPVSLRVYAANYVIAKADLDLPYVYIVSQADVNSTQPSFLLRLNTATNLIESAIRCGSGVTDLAVHYMENRIYLTNWKTGVLRAYDRATLAQVQSYQFSPAGATGYGSGDAYVVAAGRAGRIMVEEQDQWVDSWLVDTVSGNKLATFYSREGGGLFDPTGRYYFHGENNSSGANLIKYDTNGDVITQLTSKRVESYSYYGTRLVTMSGDGSRVFWNGGVFDANLNVLMQLNEEVISSTYRAELLFTNTKAINGSNSQTLATLPVDTKVQAVSGDQKKLFLFKNSAFSVVNLATIANVSPRGLIPGIADGSTVIGTSQELTWSQEAIALSYDVYFGTSAAAVGAATKASPEFLGNVTGTRWTGALPALMLGGNYFWRIDLNGFSSVTKGATWSFGVSTIDVTPRSVKLATPSGAPVPTQSLAMTAGTATGWTASSTTPWITVRTSSGTTPSTLLFDINTSGQTVGTKNGSITVQAAGKSFSIPVELSVVTLNVTKLITHPNRPVVYGINTSLAGEGFCHLLEINPATAAIQRSIPIGFAPTDADLDPISERLYISNWSYSQTRVIDVAAWVELPSLNLGEDVFKLEITPKGRLVTEGEDQWVQLSMWNAATGANLASSSTPYFSVREGDGQADPTGNFYYRCDNNSSGATVQKYNIAADTFVQTVAGPQIGSGSRNLILSENGERLFWLGRVFDANLNTLALMPGEIHATNRTGALAVGPAAIWWSDSSTEVATLPFSSTVAAFSSGDSHLLRFNATTRTLHSIAVATLSDLPGPSPRPGQLIDASPEQISWSPVNGATSYRFHIANSSAALSALTVPSATVSSPAINVQPPLDFGRFYFWRADAVLANGSVVTGLVRSFGIKHPSGPPISGTGTGIAASLADRHLFVGFDGSAQLYHFNSTSGVSQQIQRFLPPTGGSESRFGATLATDAEKVIVGAARFANPASSGGAVFACQPSSSDSGYWESGNPLLPPSPVANENFGQGLATSGNLMLAGNGSSFTGPGRVSAFLLEPGNLRTQTFLANDAVPRDGFGHVITMQGNHAVIAAPGVGAAFNRLPVLYAFNRSTTTGLWQQSQKITIPGAVSSSTAIRAIALSGNRMATNVGTTGVAIFNRNSSGQWVFSTTITRTSVAGSSTSFGASLALVGDQLFIGDPAAPYLGSVAGSVFNFRLSGTTWVAGPVIVPSESSSTFGTALSVRDRWLLVAGSGSRSAWLYQVSSADNRTPRFIQPIPTQVVVSRAISNLVMGDAADGNQGLIIDKLQGPAWLNVTDNGNGRATLSGTPSGTSGDFHTVQLRVRDTAGAEALYAYQLTLLSSTDLPILDSSPLAADLGVGQELVLRASVSGIGPFQWQWFKDGEAIVGATSSSYIVSEVGLQSSGRYHVRVTNVVGPVESAAVAVIVRPADRYAGDWLTFGGSPSHTGRHPAALEGTHFQPAWTTVVQPGMLLNRAAISNGRAVVVPTGRFSSGIDVRALDLTTGASLWTFPVPSSNSVNPPSIHQDNVYFQRGKGTGDIPQLFRLNAVTGQQIWASTFGAQWESYEAPAVTDQGIYVNGGGYGGMYGFNFNGSERFFHGLAQYDRWTPTLANGRLFSWVAGGFTEHNPNDGSVLWSLNSGWDWSGWSMNTVSAVSGNSAAVISTTELLCVDLPSRSVRWRVPAVFRGSPAIADGRVFAIQGNTVRSYSLATGSPDLVYQAGAGISSLIEQPILFNDRLVISSESQTLVFNLQDGKLLQTLAVGGRLSYSNGYLLAAGSDGTMRAFAALNFNPLLASLTSSSGDYLPEFQEMTPRYIDTVPFDTTSITLTPTTAYPDASVKVNGVPSPNGSASAPIALQVGENQIPIVVTAEDGITTMTYTMVVTRLPQQFVFNSPDDIPLTANGFLTSNFPVDVILSFHPAPGTSLTMVNNTSLSFIFGRFANLAHGQRITLRFDGMAYAFVANYHGGTGNDLVLQWADTIPMAWGQNDQGQLGNGTATHAALPVSVAMPEGVLAGKTIFALSAGYLHSLALLQDGTIAAWGYNIQGQLGLGHQNSSHSPAQVGKTGALAEKTVIAIAAGAFHNLALCDDGTIVSWGANTHGQLGTGDRVMRSSPVVVAPVGALAGKRVVAIAAGFYHSLVLCDDGKVVAWGYNDEGELGDGTSTTALAPVAVDVSGALAGKSVSRISAGQYHSLALCTDGTLAAWGYNARGQIGDGTTTDRRSPTLVNLTGITAGAAVQSISAGGSHNLVRLANGNLAGWGDNARRQLNATGGSRLLVPQVITTATHRAFSAGASHSLSLRDTEVVNLWGDARASSSTVVPLAGASVMEGARFVSVVTGASAFHNLASVALPTQTVIPPAPLSAWRQDHFGITASVGDAEDCFDCDGDGIPNLVEYAFGFDPLVNCGGKVPMPQRVGDRLEMRFTLDSQAMGVESGVEWSPDLSPGSWRDVPNSGSGIEQVYSMPTTGHKSLFMRIKVKAAPTP